MSDHEHTPPTEAELDVLDALELAIEAERNAVGADFDIDYDALSDQHLRALMSTDDAVVALRAEVRRLRAENANLRDWEPAGAKREEYVRRFTDAARQGPTP